MAIGVGNASTYGIKLFGFCTSCDLFVDVHARDDACIECEPPSSPNTGAPEIHPAPPNNPNLNNSRRSSFPMSPRFPIFPLLTNKKGSRRPKQSSDRQPAYLSCFVQSFEKSGRLKSNIP